MQFAYDGSSSPDHHLRLLSETLGLVIQSRSGPFGLHTDMCKMTAQEIMDAKALAASKSHSEAERRRRERINNHLARLRSLLPNTTKVEQLDVGALVSIRGIGRVTLVKFSKIECWAISWIAQFSTVAEHEEWQTMNAALGISAVNSLEDRWKWIRDEDTFSVKSLKRMLQTDNNIVAIRFKLK
ncbi:hypothetical protein M8C21_026916, partial [Ambrosia artemisiifolia]